VSEPVTLTAEEVETIRGATLRIPGAGGVGGCRAVLQEGRALDEILQAAQQELMLP